MLLNVSEKDSALILQQFTLVGLFRNIKGNKNLKIRHLEYYLNCFYWFKSEGFPLTFRIWSLRLELSNAFLNASYFTELANSKVAYIIPKELYFFFPNLL